ncbi:TetR/AcrR family transcriptional regulator [Paenirhodobacter sp.]|uniref:TetR/AcrR family transcriptional regulator n=1 Tax=Paenirhodobacter sp. TaxID=1965326 RepID=UPI003B40E5F1
MDVKPRKIPRQSRAQATGRAIIEATVQILVQAGFERMTTALVAQRAGVSIGSLYQYYPNKQALAAAVVDHYGEVFAARFAQAIDEAPGDTLARTVDALAATAFRNHPHDPRLHRVLIEIAPRIGHSKTLSARIAALIEARLRRHADELAGDLNPDEAAVMLEVLLENAAHRALEQHPASLPPERLADQCRRMIMAYLTCPQSGG